MNKLFVRIVALILCGLLLLSLVSMVFADELVTDEGVFLTITTREEFLEFAEKCRLDSFSQGLTVQLTADIDLTDADFAAIPIFCGTFDGGGHTISGVRIAGDGSAQGLFRYLTETALVRDLTVTGAVTPGGSGCQAGGIAGVNGGRIEDCTFSGEVSGTDQAGGIVGCNEVGGIIAGCTVSGTVSGSHFVGGVAGINKGTIHECTNLAQVNTTEKQNSVDISDITLGTITGAETTITVTDIGGIAGANSGSVTECVNRGDVGYQYMGYNVGGIAGSQSGYLSGCINYGSIRGRKEVGGIVGQLEPYTTISFATDTLQILKEQVADLSEMASQATANIKENVAAVNTLVARLEQYIADIEDAVDQLRSMTENPQVESLEDIREDTQKAVSLIETIYRCLAGIDETIDSLYAAIKTTTSQVGSDLHAISDQVSVIENTLNHASDNLGGTVTDVSDDDNQEQTHSKVANCVNYGKIVADLNGGGIVGAVAVESDLDPEEDVQLQGENTLNYDVAVRAVVRQCSNSGTVSVRKQRAGGIVGWMSMGLTRDCFNTGRVEADSADYVGGIAGSSQGYIRGCGAKCSVSGDVYVGGIAGEGVTLTDCRSMVHLTGGRERLGAIAGWAEDRQSVENNFYVILGTDMGGIDGISYACTAESMTLEAFLAQEDLPELFSTVTLRFILADGSQEILTMAPGDVLTADGVPAVPEKSGHTGHWAGLDAVINQQILFDQTFEAVYFAYSGVIASGVQANGLNMLLLEGSFPEGTALTLERWLDAPVLVDNASTSEIWKFSLTQDAAVTRARFLLPQNCAVENVKLWVAGTDGWRSVGFTQQGSYIVFDLQEGDSGLALVEMVDATPEWTVVLAAAAVAVIVMVTFIVLLCRKKSHRPALQATQVEKAEHIKEGDE